MCLAFVQKVEGIHIHEKDEKSTKMLAIQLLQISTIYVDQ